MTKKKSQSRLRHSILALAAATTLALPMMADAQQMPPTPPGGITGQAMPDRPERSERPRPPKPTPIDGTVSQYIYRPRGEVEGVILKTAEKITQVNFPPGIGTLAATIAPIGKDVKLLGRQLPPPPPGRGPPPDAAPVDHDVVEFAGLDTGDRIPPTTSPAADSKVEGTVAALNYGRRGEVNGAVLDSGDVVDVGPREAAELKLAVGQKISATGDANPIVGGRTIIGAKEVNGVEIKRPGPRPPHGPEGDDKGPPEAK